MSSAFACAETESGLSHCTDVALEHTYSYSELTYILSYIYIPILQVSFSHFCTSDLGLPTDTVHGRFDGTAFTDRYPYRMAKFATR